jgi:hypothetical protein
LPSYAGGPETACWLGRHAVHEWGGPELGKVTLKSNGDEALSDEFLLKSNDDEALNDVFP